MGTIYEFQFTSTTKDLLDAEAADMTDEVGIRGWMRWALALIGLLMVTGGLFGVKQEPLWEPLVQMGAGSVLVYYFFARSYLRRCRIRRNNPPTQDLVLEIQDECILIEASGLGTFRRDWEELMECRDIGRGVLLYFDDGIVNLLPDRVFSGKAEKSAFVEYLCKRRSQCPDVSNDS